MKRQSLFLFGWLLLATSVTAQAQFSYTLTNGTVTITGYTGSGGLLVIPDTIMGLPVTAIGDSAFYGNTSMTSLRIPNSLTTIGEQAFSDCTSLTGVTIGNGVTSIGYSAFYDCSSLTSVTVPNSVTYIGELAFASEVGSSLTSVYFQGNAPALGVIVFGGALVPLDNATAY